MPPAATPSSASTDGRSSHIVAPTLVIAGADDPATPVAMSEELACGIKDAELSVVPHASHLASVEQPTAVTDAIAKHLETPAMTFTDPGEAGMEVRARTWVTNMSIAPTPAGPTQRTPPSPWRSGSSATPEEGQARCAAVT
jgi:hypothetical protein